MFKNRKIEALKEIAQTIVNNDPELTTLQARYREIGFSEAESLSMALGRAFSVKSTIPLNQRRTDNGDGR